MDSYKTHLKAIKDPPIVTARCIEQITGVKDTETEI